jgi:hypothetical protein
MLRIDYNLREIKTAFLNRDECAGLRARANGSNRDGIHAMQKE